MAVAKITLIVWTDPPGQKAFARVTTLISHRFPVHNKIFATCPAPDGETVVLRLAPANVDTLISADPVAFWDEWRGRWLGVA